MTPDELADLLAERLSEIAPPGFRVVADGGMLKYSLTGTALPAGSSGTYVRENFREDEPLADSICLVAWRALDEFQDYVDEATTMPWPGTGGNVPAAHAAVRGSRVHLWYGEEESPTL